MPQPQIPKVQHRVPPADLGILIAAAIPDLGEQEAAGNGPAPLTLPLWPWTEASLRNRLAEARNILAQRTCTV